MRGKARLAGVLAMTFAVAACSSRGAPEGDRDQSGRPIEAVSSVPPDPKALQQPGEARPVLRLPRVESVGDCAPRHETGQTGTCVDGQPCRGFGVRDEAGRVFCTCYGQVGGCAVGQRCDERKLACVPEDEPPPGLPRAP